MPTHAPPDAVGSTLPPVLYVPTLTLTTDEEVWVDMRHTNDGRVALFVYSALDRLVEMYGPETPWALLTIKQLQSAYEQAPYDLLFLDQPAPWADGRRPAS